MKITSLQHKAGCLLIAASALVACRSNQNKAETAARAFLQAYYVDLDFTKALQLSSDASHPAIGEKQEAAALNPYARQETPDIVFKSVEIDPKDPQKASCTYLADGMEKTLPLRKLNKKWLVHVPQGTVESEGIEIMELSSGRHGGFAAAASGPVVYKKRKKN